MQQRHGVPALLSFFFPGLGQLVKGQWKRAVGVWTLLVGPWIALGITTSLRGFDYAYPPSVQDILLMMLKSPFFFWILLINIPVQLWSVVDAYRRPESFLDASGPNLVQRTLRWFYR